MSRSEENGRCPDKGNWCGYIRDWCDGTCDIVEREKEQAELADLKARRDNALAKIKELSDLETVFNDEASGRISEVMDAVRRELLP